MYIQLCMLNVWRNKDKYFSVLILLINVKCDKSNYRCSQIPRSKTWNEERPAEADNRRRQSFEESRI